MKAKEFLDKKTLAAVETAGDLILNLVVDNVVYGLKVDTSAIEAGTKLERTTNFKIKKDVLTANGVSVNLATTDMLFSDSK